MAFSVRGCVALVVGLCPCSAALPSREQWRSKYMHLTMRRGRKIAKVAMARKLAVRLFWMMRQGWDYQQVMKFGSHVEQLGTGDGVQ